MTETRKNYYPALTGIRAIAVWMVFIHHFNPFTVKRFGDRIHLFFSELHIGVTVFFVLSGLLITLRYYDNNIYFFKEFYNYFIKRFSRIFPIFFIILIANFLFLIHTNVYQNNWLHGWKTFVASALLFDVFIKDFGQHIIPQSWSLTVEESFYLLCPVIFFLIKKNKKYFVIIPFVLISAGLLITLLLKIYDSHIFINDFRFLFNFTFFGRCIEFFAGIGTALIYKRLSPPKKKGYIFTIIGTIIIFTCILSLSFLHTINFSGDHHPIGILINNLILPVAGISVLFWGLLTEINILSTFLATKIMQLFGKSSYIFYLLHMGFIMTLLCKNVTQNLLIIFLFFNLISIILYTVFEKPLNIQFRKMLLRS